jgi:hypothetical protein
LQHFACSSEGIHILLGRDITEHDLVRAELLLKSFYENCSDLYGEASCGLNVHNLQHYVSCVRTWGPLWAWSCFGFESCNGEILRSVHGTGNVCSQIFWSLQAQKHLELEVEKLEDGHLKSYFVKQLRGGTKQLPPHIDAHKCQVVTPIRLVADLPEVITNKGIGTGKGCQNFPQ